MEKNIVDETLQSEFLGENKTSFDKMLGQSGIRFYEFRIKDGITTAIPHIALPITIKDMDSFYDILDATDLLRLEGEEKMKIFQKEINELSSDMPKEDFTKKANTLKQKLRDMNRKYLGAINEKRLELALLCFSRSEETSIEKLKEWVSADILNKIETVALGITIPPKP